jgi:hypothetical protein
VSGAEFVGQLIATDTMTSFQRARQIVEAGVNDSTVPRTRTHANFWKRFEQEDISPASGECAGDRAPDDPTADDHYVGLVHALEFIRTAPDSFMDVTLEYPRQSFSANFRRSANRSAPPGREQNYYP